MPVKWIGFLFVLLLLATGLFWRGRDGGYPQLATASRIDGQAVGAAWNQAESCASFPARALDLPGSDSDYIQGLQALSAGDVASAQTAFQLAVERQQHPLALVFLANLATEPTEEAIYPGTWTDAMRLDLVRHYLAVAGRCDLAGERDTARLYLERGASFLPAGGIAELPIAAARAAANIYLRDQNSAAALPWLERAAEANDASLIRLATLLFELGRLEEAAVAYERALIYYPQRGATRYEAAQVAVARGDIPGALALLEAVEDPLELDIQVLLFWADLCAQTGDPGCQEEQYRRVLTKDPDNEAATAGLQGLQP